MNERQHPSTMAMDISIRNELNNSDEGQRLLPPVQNPPVKKELKSPYRLRAEKTIIRKIDRRLIPLSTLLYFLSYLDRMSIGIAYLFWNEKDSKRPPSIYNWAISIFYVSYVLCEVPSIYLMKLFGPPKWISFQMLTWGTIMILMMLANNTAGLLISRFFLAYGIGQLEKDSSLSGWQWIFLCEGVPTVCLAFVTYKYLADAPAKEIEKRSKNQTKWWTVTETDILINLLQEDIESIGDIEDKNHRRQVRLALADWKMWYYMLINFGALTPVFCLSAFFPSIISEISGTPIIAQLLTVPPCIVACIVTIIFSWNAGRVNDRGYHIMISLLIGMSGFLYLVFAQKYSYIAVFPTCIGVFSCYALIPSWVTANILGQTKRAVVIGSLTASGSIGGIISGQIYRPFDSSSYRLGHCIIIGIMGFTFILVLVLKLVLNYENKRRLSLSEEKREEEIDSGEGAWLLDKHPNFTYIT